MNTLIRLFFLFFISPALYADYYNENYIPGVRLIRQYADIETNINGVTTNSSESGNGIGLYLEKYYQNKYRLNGAFSYIAYDNFDIVGLTYSADYLFPINDNISLFSGLTLGSALQKYESASISDSSFRFNYGLQFGTMNFINENLLLELGLIIKATNMKTEIDTTPETSITIDRFTEFNINLLLMF